MPSETHEGFHFHFVKRTCAHGFYPLSCWPMRTAYVSCTLLLKHNNSSPSGIFPWFYLTYRKTILSKYETKVITHHCSMCLTNIASWKSVGPHTILSFKKWTGQGRLSENDKKGIDLYTLILIVWISQQDNITLFASNQSTTSKANTKVGSDNYKNKFIHNWASIYNFARCIQIKNRLTEYISLGYQGYVIPNQQAYPHVVTCNIYLQCPCFNNVNLQPQAFTILKGE